MAIERMTELSPLDHFFHWCFQHWLTLVNILVLLYSGLPWLAPWLIANGYTQPGELLFMLYTPLCHQGAGSSFFFLGEQVAYCHRDAAIYTSLLLVGLVYSQVRRWLVAHPLPWRWFLLLLLPTVLDAGTHMLGNLLPHLNLRDPNDALWSFNWWMRMITGVLLALGVLLAVYPRIDRDLRGVGEDETASPDAA